MHGFKSFAKRTELLFGPQFNCILGPNGSGKSNVLDALCFVLGKTSAKSLRAEKASNLIYNGGKKKQPSKQAEVSIYFDNTSGIFPTEDKEIKVSRIVKARGNSVYKINDETRTRQQVVELLSLAKINPDGYNIILQGDIHGFVGMSSVEKRRVIEEVAGISVYEERKNKALKELEKVEGKVKEAEIVLTEKKVYLKGLESDKNTASKYKDAKEELSKAKATEIRLRIGNAETKQKAFFKELERVDKLIDKELSKQDRYTSLDEDKQKAIRERVKATHEKKGITNERIEEFESKKEEITKKVITKLENSKKYKEASPDKQKKLKSELKREVNKRYNFEQFIK